MKFRVLQETGSAKNSYGTRMTTQRQGIVVETLDSRRKYLFRGKNRISLLRRVIDDFGRYIDFHMQLRLSRTENAQDSVQDEQLEGVELWLEFEMPKDIFQLIHQVKRPLKYLKLSKKEFKTQLLCEKYDSF